MTDPAPLSRRRFVLAGAVAAVLGACGRGRGPAATATSPATDATGTTTRGGAPTETAAGAPGPPGPGTLPPTSATGPLGPARYVPNGDRAGSPVALTFHASGDPALAEQLLDVVN